MEYVEFLRVRKALVIVTIVLAVLVLLNVGAHFFAPSTQASHGGVTVTIDSDGSTAHRSLSSKFRIPLEILAAIAGFVAIIFASIVSTSLNKENDFAHFAFTKPFARDRMALRFMAIDGAGILASFGIAALGIFVVFAAGGLLGRVDASPRAYAILLVELGMAFMWYGILQAVTAVYRGKGGTLAAVSWIVFGVLIGIRDQPFLGPVFGPLVRALDFFNPFAYAVSVGADHHGGMTVVTMSGLSLQMDALVTFTIAIVFCAAATQMWKRVEA